MEQLDDYLQGIYGEFKCVLNNEKKELFSFFGSSLLKLLSDGIYFKIGSKIIFSNPSANNIFTGNSENSVVGYDIKHLLIMEGENLDLYCKAMMQLEIQGELSPTRVKIRRRSDNEEKYLEFEGKNYIFKGKKIFVGIIRDISDSMLVKEYREEYEKSANMLDEMLKSDMLKTQFYENLSHELRTPLNVILGAVQLQNLIFDKNTCEVGRSSARKYNRIIRQNCYKLLRIVNNLLDITKLEYGRMDLQLKNSNIIAEIEDVTMSVVEYASSKGIELIFDTDIEEKYMAFDEDSIERIMMNLLSNAVKFTSPGKKIFVNVKDLQNQLLISVKDEGEGIAKEELEKIFDRFSQVDSNLTRRSKGTGIGLSLVKYLVDLYEGSIWVDSKLNEGTEFTIKLPVKLVEDDDSKINENFIRQNKIERACVEFSDIYNLE
ncbi:PAS domain-containing sensor histidine kinase [Clostridium sp. 19966]|uniref:PAS domain-containing sensor histidine kinase n=1 Tax=Clostridium sp. 19966 TaxID=2768166 RepID=UPI0028DE4AED|nr:PAS domain-containing sensor histidine kinase [Clostridium sp. 19966]MDT8718584.1 PAS domain-containing sensor histidine kinase [Clostridium sp. 19966]